MTDAALQSVNSDHDGRPIEHLDKAVEEAFVIMGSWLEVFFQNALGIPDSLNSQFLVAHGSKLHAT